MTIGGLILAGGLSSRMGGVSKAGLMLDGETYLVRIAAAFGGFDEKLLSVAAGSDLSLEGFRRVEDIYPQMGPMGGLCSALKAAESDALAVSPCDTPFMSRELTEYLTDEFRADDDILVIEDGGRLHPLVGVYSRRCIPVMERCIAAGRLRMMGLADELRFRSVPLPQGMDRRALLNINSAEDVIKLMEK